MRLNPLLVAAAAIYGIMGLGLTFAPGELLGALGAPEHATYNWVAQLLGAALLGLAYLNYLQRYTKTFGIVGRPVLLANLMFLTVAFLSTVRNLRNGSPPAVPALAVVLGALVAGFAARLYSRGGAGATAAKV